METAVLNQMNIREFLFKALKVFSAALSGICISHIYLHDFSLVVAGLLSLSVVVWATIIIRGEYPLNPEHNGDSNE